MYHLESGNICGERIEGFRESGRLIPMVATDPAFLPSSLQPYELPLTWM